MGEQLKEEEEKASSFNGDILDLIRMGKCHMISQKVMSAAGQPGLGEGDTRQSS